MNVARQLRKLQKRYVFLRGKGQSARRDDFPIAHTQIAYNCKTYRYNVSPDVCLRNEGGFGDFIAKKKRLRDRNLFLLLQVFSAFIVLKRNFRFSGMLCGQTMKASLFYDRVFFKSRTSALPIHRAIEKPVSIVAFSAGACAHFNFHSSEKAVHLSRTSPIGAISAYFRRLYYRTFRHYSSSSESISPTVISFPSEAIKQPNPLKKGLLKCSNCSNSSFPKT